MKSLNNIIESSCLQEEFISEEEMPDGQCHSSNGDVEGKSVSCLYREVPGLSDDIACCLLSLDLCMGRIGSYSSSWDIPAMT